MAKRKPKTKIFEIAEPVFKTSPVVFANCSYKEFKRLAAKHLPWARKQMEAQADEDNDVDGVVLHLKDGVHFARVVWVESLTRKSDLAVLIHELFHLVVRVLRDKGVPIKANIETGECGDETAAYLLECYVNACLKQI